MPDDVKIWTGSAWESIKGPKGDRGEAGPAGDPGPQAVSSTPYNALTIASQDGLVYLDSTKLPGWSGFVSGDDANVIVAGSDGKAYLSQNTLDARYVNLTGDTMTGALTAPALTVTGNITSTGAAHSFAQGSIPSIAMGPLTLVGEAASRTITATDAGKVLVGSPPANTDLTFTLPAAGAAGIVAGLVVELVSIVPTTGRFVFVQAPAGVALQYNSTLSGAGDGTLGGGAAARIRLRGPVTSARIMAISGSAWWAFGDIVEA